MLFVLGVCCVLGVLCCGCMCFMWGKFDFVLIADLDLRFT